MATVSDKPIVLYSYPTPNGVTASIFLEELKAQYGGPDYEPVLMSIRDADIGKVHNQVKSDWFLQLNPNGRIPTITHEGFPVFETSAILLYLAEEFDKERKFSIDPVKDRKGYSEELQWLFFSHGGQGPMQGQAGHFRFGAPEQIPYAIDRYINETKRLYGVFELRLKDRDYLAGPGRGTYGIADIKAFGWARSLPNFKISYDEFPSVKRWFESIVDRDAVKLGVTIPSNK